MNIPADLEDAARIDGCGSWGVLWTVIVPLSKPALITSGSSPSWARGTCSSGPSWCSANENYYP